MAGDIAVFHSRYDTGAANRHGVGIPASGRGACS